MDIKKVFKPAFDMLIFVILIICVVAIPVLGMFGIAALVDKFGAIYMLLFIPWFLCLSYFVDSEIPKDNKWKR